MEMNEKFEPEDTFTKAHFDFDQLPYLSNPCINTDGSYVAIEAALDIIASAIEANGGGVDLVANSDFGGIGLIASVGVTDAATDAVDSLSELISTQQEFISEVISDLIYHRRDIGEFVIGVLYQTAANNLEDALKLIVSY